MDKQSKENFINKNTVYIHGEFDIDIIEILPLIRKEIDNQKTLKNGKIIFSINSVGGYVYILISLLFHLRLILLDSSSNNFNSIV